MGTLRFVCMDLTYCVGREQRVVHTGYAVQTTQYILCSPCLFLLDYKKWLTCTYLCSKFLYAILQKKTAHVYIFMQYISLQPILKNDSCVHIYAVHFFTSYYKKNTHVYFEPP